MALTQRALKECADEALAALQAYDLLRDAIERTLADSQVCAEGKLVLLRHILGELGVGTAPASERALEHIGRTSARNAARALKAKKARQERNSNGK